MGEYLIVKRFIIGQKTYYKDKILTGDMPKKLMDRLVAKGFVKSIGEASVDYEEIPFYEELEGFLTPREVNRLGKADLIKYAGHIEAEIDSTLPKAAIAKAVNGFIAEATKVAEDDEDEGDDDDDKNKDKVDDPKDNAPPGTPPREV